MADLLSDHEVIERVFSHIDHGTTDEGDEGWREPVENYHSQSRLQRELSLYRKLPLPFCPSVALPEAGSYVARTSAGTPLIVVRDDAGQVRGYRNACRHRGMQVVDATAGCTEQARAFVCGYHGWAYKLDGRLQYIPHEHGFPDLDRGTHGLVPVQVTEKHGLVWVSQEAPISDGGMAEMPNVLTDQQQIFSVKERTQDVNWKLNAEAALEGYHIKPTHKETFFPYGFDNLNVVETFGANSRVTFPFRRIEKLRNVLPEQRVIDGSVTYVYFIFPNTTVAVLSNHTSVSFAEPETTTRTRFVTYQLTNRQASGRSTDTDRAKKDASFVTDSGGAEDRAVIQAIQAGLESGANTHFVYGRFEKAIVHFHKTLTGLLEQIS